MSSTALSREVSRWLTNGSSSREFANEVIDRYGVRKI
jgi:hypothetical protein